MNQALQIHQRQPLWKSLLAAGMMLLLLWLTCINFLYLNSNNQCPSITCMTDAGEDEESACNYPGNPAGPDEKSPDAPISIIEEYIHEHGHEENNLWVNMLFQHKVHEAEKLTVVHPESFSPPPEV
jgi:hypothetical protein